MTKIIKIEREHKNELFISGTVYVAGILYAWKEGEHSYILQKIVQDVNNEWILKFPEGISMEADTAHAYIERTNAIKFRKCECNFLCEGYILKDIFK